MPAQQLQNTMFIIHAPSQLIKCSIVGLFSTIPTRFLHCLPTL